MPISVIIPSYRNPEYLDLCLTSLFENQDADNEIIVVLDGYGDESAAVLQKHTNLGRDVNVVEFSENKGQQTAHNTGVWMASNDAILILNDDNVMPTHWDSRLEDLCLGNVVWALNQVEPTPSIFPSFVHHDFGKHPAEFKYTEYLEWERRTSHLRCTVDGATWPVFMSKRLYMMCGGIDVSFPSPAVADWDFFLRLRLSDAALLRMHKIHVYHFGGAATKKTPEIAARHAEKEAQSFQYFEYKWGFSPSLRLNDNSYAPRGEVVRGIRLP